MRTPYRPGTGPPHGVEWRYDPARVWAGLAGRCQSQARWQPAAIRAGTVSAACLPRWHHVGQRNGPLPRKLLAGLVRSPPFSDPHRVSRRRCASTGCHNDRTRVAASGNPAGRCLCRTCAAPSKKRSACGQGGLRFFVSEKARPHRPHAGASSAPRVPSGIGTGFSLRSKPPSPRPAQYTAVSASSAASGTRRRAGCSGHANASATRAGGVPPLACPLPTARLIGRRPVIRASFPDASPFPRVPPAPSPSYLQSRGFNATALSFSHHREYTGEDDGERKGQRYESATLQIAEQGRFECGVHRGGCRE